MVGEAALGTIHPEIKISTSVDKADIVSICVTDYEEHLREHIANLADQRKALGDAEIARLLPPPSTK